ncbi:hypothetical protein CBR_g46657 [Chara braunii]|uniref:Uncharacterized protein n=1 Tax=Chara braunii TaxID=69332 RepID=A0A388M109_CHABU|nr:hypothetical protein CBR_g46657 [Chara braunii]|eukprot:GBG88169.1 hypothetical protein CBR_g46657 [Chara braunii]
MSGATPSFGSWQVGPDPALAPRLAAAPVAGRPLARGVTRSTSLIKSQKLYAERDEDTSSLPFGWAWGRRWRRRYFVWYMSDPELEFEEFGQEPTVTGGTRWEYGASARKHFRAPGWAAKWLAAVFKLVLDVNDLANWAVVALFGVVLVAFPSLLTLSEDGLLYWLSWAALAQSVVSILCNYSRRSREGRGAPDIPCAYWLANPPREGLVSDLRHRYIMQLFPDTWELVQYAAKGGVGFLLLLNIDDDVRKLADLPLLTSNGEPTGSSSTHITKRLKEALYAGAAILIFQLCAGVFYCIMHFVKEWSPGIRAFIWHFRRHGSLPGCLAFDSELCGIPAHWFMSVRDVKLCLAWALNRRHQWKLRHKESQRRPEATLSAAADVSDKLVDRYVAMAIDSLSKTATYYEGRQEILDNSGFELILLALKSGMDIKTRTAAASVVHSFFVNIERRAYEEANRGVNLEQNLPGFGSSRIAWNFGGLETDARFRIIGTGNVSTAIDELEHLTAYYLRAATVNLIDLLHSSETSAKQKEEASRALLSLVVAVTSSAFCQFNARPKHRVLTCLPRWLRVTAAEELDVMVDAMGRARRPSVNQDPSVEAGAVGRRRPSITERDSGGIEFTAVGARRPSIPPTRPLLPGGGEQSGPGGIPPSGAAGARSGPVTVVGGAVVQQHFSSESWPWSAVLAAIAENLFERLEVTEPMLELRELEQEGQDSTQELERLRERLGARLSCIRVLMYAAEAETNTVECRVNCLNVLSELTADRNCRDLFLKKLRGVDMLLRLAYPVEQKEDRYEGIVRLAPLGVRHGTVFLCLNCDDDSRIITEHNLDTMERYAFIIVCCSPDFLLNLPTAGIFLRVIELLHDVTMRCRRLPRAFLAKLGRSSPMFDFMMVLQVLTVHMNFARILHGLLSMPANHNRGWSLLNDHERRELRYLRERAGALDLFERMWRRLSVARRKVIRLILWFQSNFSQFLSRDSDKDFIKLFSGALDLLDVESVQVPHPGLVSNEGDPESTRMQNLLHDGFNTWREEISPLQNWRFLPEMSFNLWKAWRKLYTLQCPVPMTFDEYLSEPMLYNPALYFASPDPRDHTRTTLSLDCVYSLIESLVWTLVDSDCAETLSTIPASSAATARTRAPPAVAGGHTSWRYSAPYPTLSPDDWAGSFIMDTGDDGKLADELYINEERVVDYTKEIYARKDVQRKSATMLVKLAKLHENLRRRIASSFTLKQYIEPLRSLGFSETEELFGLISQAARPV